MIQDQHVIWVEKYRPHKIADCILPSGIKATFEKIVESGVIPNMFLTGTPGTGKTTAAKALCEELDYEYLFINASENGNIDTLRTEIREFASTASFSGARRVVILDEADYLNPNSTQPALRAFIEEFAANVSFIFTCNNIRKLISPLYGRAAIIEYVIPAAEREGLARQFYTRLKYILESEGVQYDKKVLMQMTFKYWPDFRRTITELQRYSMTGAIDETILDQVRDVPLSELVKALKAKDFQSVRKWCAVHHDTDSVSIMRKLYDIQGEVFKKSSIPDVVVLIGTYQYRAAFVTDHELHLVAFLTELMLLDTIQE